MYCTSFELFNCPMCGVWDNTRARPAQWYKKSKHPDMEYMRENVNTSNSVACKCTRALQRLALGRSRHAHHCRHHQPRHSEAVDRFAAVAAGFSSEHQHLGHHHCHMGQLHLDAKLGYDALAVLCHRVHKVTWKQTQQNCCQHQSSSTRHNNSTLTSMHSMYSHKDLL